ncbi:hypothetical protein NQ317_002032 [Molorchus minor]|uniref:EGF-like domain-containing protein n=1 Tax=Molorchus minor TaxID=1323400 RepID=A0ABQ9JKK0_9CUCU|nr:hypothetical protein NQ317_002032 [Molorchus minor]
MWKTQVSFLTVAVVLCLSTEFISAQVLLAPHRVNNTRRGVCTIEVPTLDILSPEDRRGVIPRGNGSRKATPKLIYAALGGLGCRTATECQPFCENGCENGNCTAPNVCECRRGYIKLQNNTCIPTCPIGCLHGVCTNTGICSCNSGYLLSPDGKYCTPTVQEAADKREPAWDLNFVNAVKETNKCGYHCEGGCGEGTCVGPNRCSCKPGYKIVQNTCAPDCPKGCTNGQCTAPNRCTCPPGWNLDGAGSSCIPHCTQPCLNADCVAPNRCACKKGYTEAPGSGGGKCVAYCPDGCPNGVCSAPNFCICNPGYIKEFKGSNVCVRRLRRSVMHFDLIPEDVLKGQ